MLKRSPRAVLGAGAADAPWRSGRCWDAGRDAVCVHGHSLWASPRHRSKCLHRQFCSQGTICPLLLLLWAPSSGSNGFCSPMRSAHS